MPVLLIVVLVVIALGATTAVVVPAIVSDPIPPSPPAPVEFRAPEFPGVAVDSTKVVLPAVMDTFVDEAPADSSAKAEEPNPYDAILEDEWNSDEPIESFDEPFEPDTEPLIEESSRTGGMVRGLGGF